MSPIGFGAFKIGRNEGAKYPSGFALPDEDAAAALLHGVLDAGITLIDTAPAYGLSEERIGRALAGRRNEFVLSTKAGERFENGVSTFDFTSAGIRRSVQSSLRRLGTDVIDVLYLHSDGNDQRLLEETDAVETVLELREAGLVRAVGLSGKTVEGARAALAWADALMVTFHLDDRSHESIIDEARAAGVGIVVKKGLASGHLAPAQAIPFVLGHRGVASLIIGGSNLEHIRANVALADRAARATS